MSDRATRIRWKEIWDVCAVLCSNQRAGIGDSASECLQIVDNESRLSGMTGSQLFDVVNVASIDGEVRRKLQEDVVEVERWGWCRKL